MADINKPKSVFYGVMQALRGSKDPAKDIQQSKNLIMGAPAPETEDVDFIQQKQQQYLDLQSVKIAQDLYSRTMFYDTDRITAYNDFRSMDMSPEIAAALDIISDEVCTRNERGNVISIYSDNLRIKKVLQELFYRTLNAEFNLSFWTRELCKYGDCFLKLEVDQKEGIYDCMMLPVGEIHKEIGYDGNPKSTRYKWDINNMFFEEWQVAHFCLLFDAARLPYGRSILDPARKLWKQLQLAEDAMLVYRLCLQGETRIRTDKGYKYIKDIEVGDNIISFNEKSELEYGTVKYHINNGKKKLYKVRSKHIELIGTDTHPVLVRRNGILQYVDIKDLEIKKDQLINPKFDEFGTIQKRIEPLYGEVFAKIKEDKIGFFKNFNTKNKTELMKECAVGDKYDFTRIKQFLYSKGKGLPSDIAVSVCEKINLNINDLIFFTKGQVNPERINLPEFVDEEFAELFGFLIGDGFIWKNGIGFAEGTDESVNNKYSELLEKYFGKVSYQPEKREGRRYGKYVVSSTAASKIFSNLGYISGAKNKRIPSWVFNCSKSIRKAFVEGISDADGGERFTKAGLWFSTIELCNKKLVEDIKELWTSTGFSSGHIGYRERKEKHIIEGTRTISGGKSWKVTISNNPLPEFENVLSVEYYGKEDVFDITVDNRLHNFIANGTPVHNTRAPERRIFYIEVGNTDPNDVYQLIESVKKSVKKSTVVDPNTGRVNLKYNPMPVWKNTPIPLLDGRTITIEELAKEFEEGKENYVYSIQDNTHGTVAGKVIWCGKNYTATKLVKVWLDDNTWIMTAPEHPFVMRDGTQKRADELNEGESLMPFYRELKQISNKGNKYETIYNPETQKYEFTHRLIANSEFIKFNNSKLPKKKKGQKYRENRLVWNKENIVRGIGGKMQFKNHKVLRVEFVDSEGEDVYCMTVVGMDGEHDRHNFACLSFNDDGSASKSGVYVKNTYEEDFFLPVRGEKSSKIETLPGASNLDAIADIEYLQNKLFASIKVPKTYLNYAESMPGGSTLSQVDLRFARTINRIQEQIVLELRRVANIHLYFLGFEDDLDNFTITLTNPSTQLELLKLETWKARMEVFKELFSSEVTSPVSYSWAMEYILGFSKSEIKQIIRQKKVEKKMFSEIERANEEYMDTGIFKELDEKFRKPDFDPEGIPSNGEDGEEGGGGSEGFQGSSVLGGGGGMPSMGGAETGAPEAGAVPNGEAGFEASTGLEAGTDLEAGAETNGETSEEIPAEEEVPPVTENILISENRKFDIQTRKLMKSIDSYLAKIKNESNDEIDSNKEIL